MASPSYFCTSTSPMWNKNQAVTHKLQDSILLPYFHLLFLSTAFCQDLAAGMKGGNTCLNHADERICFVPWGFCISVLWPQSHLSINYRIHFKEQVWPCCLFSSGTAVDTTSTKAWQSFKIYLEIPWSFKIGFWIDLTDACLLSEGMVRFMIDYILAIQETSMQITISYKPQTNSEECLGPCYYFMNILLKAEKYTSWRVLSCL